MTTGDHLGVGSSAIRIAFGSIVAYLYQAGEVRRRRSRLTLRGTGLVIAAPGAVARPDWPGDTMNLLVKVAVAAAGVGLAGVAGLAVAGCAATGAATGAAAPRGSVAACTAFGVRAIEQHQTVTQVPAACRGLSRAEVNFALGRSIYLVAGTGHHKVAWRRDAAVAGARLAGLITTAMAQSPGAPAASGAAPAAGQGTASRPGPVDRRPLGLAALAAWLLTVGSGGYMLLRFVAGGGLRWPRAAGARTGSAVVLTHFGLASSGLLLWALYLATSWLALAWLALGLLLPIIGFGMATLIVWTSGSSRRTSGTSHPPSGTPGTPGAPSGTSGAPSGASPAFTGPSRPRTEPSQPRTEPSPAAWPGQVQLTEVRGQEPAGQTTPGRRPSRWLTVVIPIGHGLLAMATILIALLTALGAT